MSAPGSSQALIPECVGAEDGPMDPKRRPEGEFAPQPVSAEGGVRCGAR